MVLASESCHLFYISISYPESVVQELSLSFTYTLSLNTKEGDNNRQGPGSRSPVVSMIKDTGTCYSFVVTAL